MPEVYFRVQWPDGQSAEYYSPSTAVLAHLQAGQSYTLPEFVARSQAAMHQASERVRQKYGYTCSSALDTLRRIEQTALGYAARPEVRVRVAAISPQASEPERS